MSGYFGNAVQQRLQMQAEASADFVRDTPGACQSGRTMGTDDPDMLGWELIDAFVDRDGVCGFRLIDASRVEDLRARLDERRLRFDTWDVFLADRAAALDACGTIIAQGLPEGLVPLGEISDPEGTEVRQIQTMMSEAGIVPFSGSMLVGAVGRAVTVAIGDGAVMPVAVAHGYMPHNDFSPFARHAWGGLVAVREDRRGRGLGNLVNAMMVAAVFEKLGATHIYELVSAANIPSRRMVAACGLKPEPELVCGMATQQELGRFTR